MKKWISVFSISASFAMGALAHPISFNSSITYTATRPSGGPDSISNWAGAAFDADNIGGSGDNADGGSDNGTANDNYTYLARYPVPTQGQTFTTGSNPDGYNLSAVTIQVAGYTNNIATGDNRTSWDLNFSNGPIILSIGKIEGTNLLFKSTQLFNTGGNGNPGTGVNANGPSTYLTFNLPFNVHLDPNTEYGFDIAVGEDSANYFEWLGIRNNAYADGSAYGRSWWRATSVTQLTGDRVFMLDMTAGPDPRTFDHPGSLHTQADLDLMKAKVAASEEPWLSGYNMLLSSPYNNLGWPAYDVDYIKRGTTSDNYTRCQQDAQLIYTLTLLWHITGNMAYADRAVYIANVWSDLIGIQGDTNASLAAGICGYLFAISGELLSTYPGWIESDKQSYKDMMMRVFYPANLDLLWRHHGTFFNRVDWEDGNTHYRLNWDTANMASIAAIGILCDNPAVYEQAVDYFKHGPGNGNVRRAAWYVHPGGWGQGEEAGRDQGHNLGGWHAMALLCQMAWNQGEDLFGYDNNRVLRAFEYNAKYNLWNDVPYTRHRNSDLSYTEGSVSAAGRGLGGYYQYELVYNHYHNIKGIAAPWSKLAADSIRPEPWPNTGIHPSQVDWFGLGSLTYSQVPTTNDLAPSGLRANWSKNRIVLDWWGAARATSYIIQRGIGFGPYVTIGTVTGPDMNFTDTNVVNGITYYYIITAVTPSGNYNSDPLDVEQKLVTHYTFEGNADDVVGTQDATPHGGSTGLPGYNTGFGGGQAIDLDGVDDYVQLPVGAANYQDVTVAAWVYWDGGSAWQRVFDFGSEIEKTMFLTPKNGSGVIEWGFTTTRGGNFTGDASYYLTGSAMPVGTWTHVAVALNGDVMTLYVNGVPVDSETNDLIDPLHSQPFCYIGKSMYNTDPLFNGRIDDFRIYNHALSGDEIYDLWGQSSGNHAPVFDSDSFERSATEDATFSGSVSATDIDGGELTYSKLTGPSWLNVASDGSLSGTPSNDYVGENYFVVRVADTSAATDDVTLWINVVNSNDAPAWTTDPIDGGNNLQGNAYSFSVAGYANDVDSGDVLTISKVDGPAWLNVGTNGVLTGTPGSSDAGVNSFTLRVSDLSGAYDDATFKVMVLTGSTVAYWNFEEGMVDTYVPYSLGSAGQYDGSILDVSGSGNHLSAWSTNWMWYRDDVPSSVTPQTGTTNTLSVQDANSYPAMSAIGTSLTTWNPQQWTIEVAFKVDAASGYQTVVGRDSYGAYSNEPKLSALYLGTRDSRVAVQFTDNAGNNWNLVSDSGVLEAGQWQAIAAVSDGSTLSLYLKNITDGEANYSLMGTLDISSSTNAALTTGTGGGGNWDAGVFSVGRGLWDGEHTDRFYGYIDDVRFSNAALGPNQLLYSFPPAPAAPTGLSAISGDSQVSLFWSAVANATGYNVKRSLTNGTGYSIVDSPVGTSMVDTGLTNGTMYYYVVSSIGIGGEGTNSVEVSAVPSADVVPGEHHIAGNAVIGGTNMSLTVSNSVLGHVYWILATDTLTPPAWSNIMIEAGNSSNLLFSIPIEQNSTNRFFQLDVQRQ